MVQRKVAGKKARRARVRRQQTIVYEDKKKGKGVGIILLCLLLLCGFMVYQRIALEEQRSEYAAQLSDMNKEKKKLQKEADSIEEHKAYVRTKSYIEQVAREKLGLVYENEIIFEAEDK